MSLNLWHCAADICAARRFRTDTDRLAAPTGRCARRTSQYRDIRLTRKSVEAASLRLRGRSIFRKARATGNCWRCWEARANPSPGPVLTSPVGEWGRSRIRHCRYRSDPDGDQRSPPSVVPAEKREKALTRSGDPPPMLRTDRPTLQFVGLRQSCVGKKVVIESMRTARLRETAHARGIQTGRKHKPR